MEIIVCEESFEPVCPADVCFDEDSRARVRTCESFAVKTVMTKRT